MASGLYSMSVFLTHISAPLSRFGKSIQKKLIEWIKEKMPSYSAVLDVGCGNGQFLAMLVSFIHLGTCDRE